MIELIPLWSVFDLIALVGGFFFALKGFMAFLIVGPVTRFAKKATFLSQLFMVADYSDDQDKHHGNSLVQNSDQKSSFKNADDLFAAAVTKRVMQSKKPVQPSYMMGVLSCCLE